jgi:hypothetical protein
MSSYQRTKLSKTAKVVRPFTRCHEMARLVGQFSGTDMPHNPGDIFVRKIRWGGICGLHNYRPVLLLAGTEGMGKGHFRWYSGCQFHIFEVVGVTPATLTVIKLRELHLYNNWDQGLGMQHEGSGGLFRIEQPISPAVRIHRRSEDIVAAAEFARIRTANAREVKSPKHIKFDSETNKLVIID